ncbi:MAG TPA: peptidylprolyl isomerase [Candidatus Acidoferrales bacterium]|nr:peptidylprolyl isomerase [Candidatus Acidoferrales bacterium]
MARVCQPYRVSRSSVVAAAALAITVLGQACQRPSAPSSEVWALVNGRPILRQQVERYYRSQFKQPSQPSPEESLFLKLNILDELIDNELMLEQAQKLGLTATDSELEQKFAQLKAPYSEKDFQAQLAQRAINVDQLKIDLRQQVAVEKLINREITSKIAVTDREIADAYNRNRAEFEVAEMQYHLAQIVVAGPGQAPARHRQADAAANGADALRKAQMLLARIRAGANFSELAAEYSEDPNTATSGGDLGFISESALNQGDPALKRAVLALKPGQTSGLIPVKSGYRIIQLLARLTPGQRSLSDPQVRQSIRDDLRDRKEQLLRAAYLANLRDQARVVNYLAREILASSGKLPAGESTAPASPAAPAVNSSPANPPQP